MLLAFGLSGVSAPEARAQQLDIKRHTLKNGMVVLTHEDHSIPMISLHIFYRCGSRNERPGITGVSHLFEHMMFNGSSKFAPKEFDRQLETSGGFSNAYTNEDVTAYHETFPSDALPLVFDLEADRMQTLRITPQNLEQERGIVAEERRVSTDNNPASRMYEELFAAAFVAHPYQWPVVGWMGDIQSIRLDEAQHYYNTYYGPNNATMIIAGDFDTATVMKQIEAKFGSIPARGDIRPVVNSEPEQMGERRVTLVKEAALPAVFVGFKTPQATHPDAPALAVLASVLSQGESSRLFQQLVYSQMAASVFADFEEHPDPSMFEFYIQAQEGRTAEECEKKLYEILRDVEANGVTAGELQKAKNQLRADAARRILTIEDKANEIGVHEVRYGDFKAMYTLLDKYDAVTNDDLKRVANTYFKKRHRTVVTLVLPKGDDKGGADDQN